MTKLPWTPWHQVVHLRDDLKSGELPLAIFAADLYDVAMQRGHRPIYEHPDPFFALTFPTYNLRELARDVVLRLAGQNDKAIRQLELTYGGGKTHTLITLYHLVNDPAHLPDLPAVQEFTSHIGRTPPPARIAVLAFDKLDVEKGMEVRGPDGETRWFKQPWSVLAFQLAGSAGLRLLHADDQDAERDSAPAENLLVSLLTLPQQHGLATLILIDEVLMYAREKVGLDPTWRSRLVNFFQYLTQAVTKVDRCALVASLLATDPARSDTLGKELTQELAAIFRREREEGVQPVVKDDVAEVLRRRFFTPDSIRDREAFRPHITAALHGIAALDEPTRKSRPEAEARFLMSYPFHPDLTDIFYTKWTNLEGFQRTRGVLRTFALALRRAATWDTAPLVGANVFLSDPTRSDLADAARELTSIAATEEYEGKRQEWTGILEGELGKARAVQRDFTGLAHRELEQAVVSIFLHSQPIGQKASLRDLLLLIGHTRPDRIDLEKALRRWTEISWFLDEEAVQDAPTGADGQRQLPTTWRLGSRPNLTQMHHDACSRVPPDLITARLLDDTSKLKALTEGASAAGVRVHLLPRTSADIADDGALHYAVLGPAAASDSGKPAAEARRYLEETTSPDTPRVYRNAVVLAVPSRDGLEMARNAIRAYLGWEEVQSQLKGQEVDALRQQTLQVNLDTTRKAIPGAIRQAYSIVVTISEKNEVQAFKLTLTNEPLFTQIKNDQRARIQDTPVSAEALLPGGPYSLWREDEPARRVKDLVSAFAQFPRLPRMLQRTTILDTLVAGCEAGTFVLRLLRPNQSMRTFWHMTPDAVALNDPGLEVVLPEHATLSDLPATLLRPGVLPGLWTQPTITMPDLRAYFAGAHVVQVPKDGFTEPLGIPQVPPEILDAAVSAAVSDGILWLTSNTVSLYCEEVPTGVLTDPVTLHAPPAPIAAIEVLPRNLPDAWNGETTTARALTDALARKTGQRLPWVTVQHALDDAFRVRFLERTPDSAGWPCDYAGAAFVTVRLPQPHAPLTYPDAAPPTAPIHESARPGGATGIRVARAILQPNEIQDLADELGDLVSAATGYGLTIQVHLELGHDAAPPDAVVQRINELLARIAAGLRLG